MNIILGFIKNNLLEVSGNFQNSRWKIIQDNYESIEIVK